MKSFLLLIVATALTAATGSRHDAFVSEVSNELNETIDVLERLDITPRFNSQATPISDIITELSSYKTPLRRMVAIGQKFHMDVPAVELLKNACMAAYMYSQVLESTIEGYSTSHGKKWRALVAEAHLFDEQLKANPTSSRPEDAFRVTKQQLDQGILLLQEALALHTRTLSLMKEKIRQDASDVKLNIAIESFMPYKGALAYMAESRDAMVKSSFKDLVETFSEMGMIFDQLARAAGLPDCESESDIKRIAEEWRRLAIRMKLFNSSIEADAEPITSKSEAVAITDGDTSVEDNAPVDGGWFSVEEPRAPARRSHKKSKKGKKGKKRSSRKKRGGPPPNDSDSVDFDEVETDSEDGYEEEATTEEPTTRAPTTVTTSTRPPTTTTTTTRPPTTTRTTRTRTTTPVTTTKTKPRRTTSTTTSGKKTSTSSTTRTSTLTTTETSTTTRTTSTLTTTETPTTTVNTSTLTTTETSTTTMTTSTSTMTTTMTSTSTATSNTGTNTVQERGVVSNTERLTIDVGTERAGPMPNPQRRTRGGNRRRREATQQIGSPIVPISQQLMQLSDILYQTAAQMHQLAYQAASSSMDDQQMVVTNHYLQTIVGALQTTEHVRHLSYNLGGFAQSLPIYIVPQPDGSEEYHPN